MAAVAQATITGQTLIAPSREEADRRSRGGPADINITVDNAFTPPQNVAPTDQLTNVDIDKDFKFTPGNMPPCNCHLDAGTTTAQVGRRLWRQRRSDGRGDALLTQWPDALARRVVAPGKVAAFNGSRPVVSPAIVLHTECSARRAYATTSSRARSCPHRWAIRRSTPRRSRCRIRPSPACDLTHFETTINKIVKMKADKKTGKRRRPVWQEEEVMVVHSETNFTGGGGQASATTTVPCTQKKTKKKK